MGISRCRQHRQGGVFNSIMQQQIHGQRKQEVHEDQNSEFAAHVIVHIMNVFVKCLQLGAPDNLKQMECAANACHLGFVVLCLIQSALCDVQ